jgi:chromosome segregation ATPase
VSEQRTLAEIEETYRHIHNLNAEYQSMRTLEDDLAVALDVARTHHALQEKCMALEEDRRQLQEAVNTLQQQHDTLGQEYQTKRHAAEHQHRQWLVSLQGEQQQAVQQVKSTKKALADLQAEIEAKTDTYTTVRADANKLQAQYEALKEDYAALQTQHTELWRTIEQLEQQRQQLIAALQGTLKGL